METLSNNGEGLVFEGFEEFMREMLSRYGEKVIRR